MSDEQRSDIILEAYRQAEGVEAANELTIATGATVQEAMSLGLLPFKIVSARKAEDPISLDDYQRAFDFEATRTLLGANASELRYATIVDAEQGLKRLQTSLPNSSWLLVQEIGVES